MDIIDHLQADLDALRELVIELRISDEDTAHEADVFSALVSMIKAQDETQEVVLESIKGRSQIVDRAIRGALDRARGAREVEQMIECCTNRSTWRASLNVYCELLEMRIHQETRELLPALHDELDSKERAKLGKDYESLRGFEKKTGGEKNWRRIWATITRAG